MSVVSSREKSPSARCESRDTIGVEFWMMVFFSAQQGIDKCFNLKLSRFHNDDVHNWKDWNIGRGWEMIDITAGRRSVQCIIVRVSRASPPSLSTCSH
jgi:hypothetical protein